MEDQLEEVLYGIPKEKDYSLPFTSNEGFGDLKMSIRELGINVAVGNLSELVQAADDEWARVESARQNGKCVGFIEMLQQCALLKSNYAREKYLEIVGSELSEAKLGEIVEVIQPTDHAGAGAGQE